MNLEQYSQQLQLLPNPEPCQSALVFGAAKSGKTSLVSQLARKYKLIWIDVDVGFQTLFYAVPKEFWPNITLVRVQDSQEKPEAIRMLTKLFKAQAEVKICEAHGHIACTLCVGKPSVSIDPKKLDSGTVVVVDTVTRAADSAMHHALGQSGEMVFKKKEYSHYDNQGLLLKGLLTSMQRFPCHKVFISQEEDIKHEDGTNKLTPMVGTRNFSAVVAGYFDHVVYTSVRNKKHCISSSTVSDVRVQAGSRNHIDIKSAEDFTNIFCVNFTEQGKKATLTFEAESEVVTQMEAEAAAKASTTMAP